MSWCYIQQISRILEQNSQAKKSWKHLPQLLKGQQRTLSGDDSSSVFTFSDPKTMRNIYENDIQLSDRCQGLVLFGLPFQTTILSIQTRFQTDLWSRTQATSARWVNSLWQTVRHVSQAPNVTTQKTLPVWCIRPQNFWFLLWNSSVCSSVKFLARITLLKWCNCNFPHKRGSLSDSKLFLEISC